MVMPTVRTVESRNALAIARISVATFVLTRPISVLFREYRFEFRLVFGFEMIFCFVCHRLNRFRLDRRWTELTVLPRHITI